MTAGILVAVVAAIVVIVALISVRRGRQSAASVARQLASAPNADSAAMKLAADAVALLTADGLAAGRLGHFARTTLAPPEWERAQSGHEQQLRSIESGIAELERRASMGRPGKSGGRYVCELLVSLPVSSA